MGRIGSEMDSFFEYLLKGNILCGCNELHTYFESAYDAIMKHYRDKALNYYHFAHMNYPELGKDYKMEALGAFFPGLQVRKRTFINQLKVLYGEIENAEYLFDVYYALWIKYDLLPEGYKTDENSISDPAYILRPELIESAFYLYKVSLKCILSFIQI